WRSKDCSANTITSLKILSILSILILLILLILTILIPTVNENATPPSPPKLAKKLLISFLRDDLTEEVQGDPFYLHLVKLKQDPGDCAVCSPLKWLGNAPPQMGTTYAGRPDHATADPHVR